VDEDAVACRISARDDHDVLRAMRPKGPVLSKPVLELRHCHGLRRDAAQSKQLREPGHLGCQQGRVPASASALREAGRTFEAKEDRLESLVRMIERQRYQSRRRVAGRRIDAARSIEVRLHGLPITHALGVDQRGPDIGGAQRA